MNDDRGSVELSSIRRCPECGETLEGGLLDAPRDSDRHAHMHTKTLLSRWHWKIPKLQALMCRECGLVIFLYGRDQGARV